MKALKQWFRSLSKGYKITLVAVVLINIAIMIGFGVLGMLWDKPIVILPIVIIAVSMILNIKQMMKY